MGVLVHWLLTALALMLVAYLLPGVTIRGFTAAMIAALVMGVINISLKPLLHLLTFPLSFVTLGLFAFVVNAAMFALAAWVVPGFEVNNFWSALLASILLAILTSLMGLR